MSKMEFGTKVARRPTNVMPKTHGAENRRCFFGSEIRNRFSTSFFFSRCDHKLSGAEWP